MLLGLLLRSLRADATGKTRKRARVNDRAEKSTPSLSYDVRLLRFNANKPFESARRCAAYFGAPIKLSYVFATC